MNMVLVNYVSYYATQVRGFLKGLSPEVVEELTGGLEADLIEAMSENTEVSDTSDITLNDLIARFGTPEAYARELCESAGVDFDGAKAAGQMPVSGALRSKSRNPFKRFGAWIASLVAAVIGLGARAQGIKFSPAVVKFLTEMRPAWWFVRGSGSHRTWLTGGCSRESCFFPRCWDWRVPAMRFLVSGVRLSLRSMCLCSCLYQPSLGPIRIGALTRPTRGDTAAALRMRGPKR
jgi:hypothetical protein